MTKSYWLFFFFAFSLSAMTTQARDKLSFSQGAVFSCIDQDVRTPHLSNPVILLTEAPPWGSEYPRSQNGTVSFNTEKTLLTYEARCHLSVNQSNLKCAIQKLDSDTIYTFTLDATEKTATLERTANNNPDRDTDLDRDDTYTDCKKKVGK